MQPLTRKKKRKESIERWEWKEKIKDLIKTKIGGSLLRIIGNSQG